MNNELKLKRIKEVIKVTADTASNADFLATHVPFTNLYDALSERNISEIELLNDYLLSDNDEHKFLLIQGNNGTGKSHLIRWLKEKYEKEINTSKDIVLIISRSHNTLKDALKQILESGIFPEEVIADELRDFRNARNSMTGEELKKTINFNITLEIDLDKDKDNLPLAKRYRRQLKVFLENEYIQNKFIFSKDGPIVRIQNKIEQKDQNEISNDLPEFKIEDFLIKVEDLNALSRGENRADNNVIRLAEALVSPSKGEQLSADIINYLNSKVASVIQRSVKLSSTNFKQIFANLRTTLKKNDSTLTLFIEDINSFTGIDEALIEVVLTDHKAIGNEQYCKLTSIVGSTTDFYENKLNDSIKERILKNVYIRESSILGTADNIAKFVSKYINAINLPKEALESWYENGAKDEELPIYSECPEWCKVQFNEFMLPIEPFNQNALHNLYKTLSIEKRTPRQVLNSIVAPISQYWFLLGNEILLDEKNFNDGFINMPTWSNNMQMRINENYGHDNLIERSILFRVWGNGTAEISEDAVGGVSEDVFKYFNIPFNFNVTKSTNAPEKVLGTIIKADVEVRKNIEIENQELQEKEEELLNWRDKNGQLKSHSMLRDLVKDFIYATFDSSEFSISPLFAEELISVKKRINIEGQTTNIDDGILIERNTKNFDFLNSLLYFNYSGKKTWDFEDSDYHLSIALAWIQANKLIIANKILNCDNIFDSHDLAKRNLTALYYINLINGNIPKNISKNELIVRLLRPLKINGDNHVHSKEWYTFKGKINKFDNIYSQVKSLYYITVGTKDEQKANYTFVDFYEIENDISLLIKDEWDIDKYSMNIGSSTKINIQSTMLINIFRENVDVAIESETTKLNSYLQYISSRIGNDYSNVNIQKTVEEINKFFDFLKEVLNSSYNDNDFTKINISKTSNILTKIDEFRNENLSKKEIINFFASDPFDAVELFEKYILNFSKLLESKHNMLNNKPEHESINDLKDKKNELIGLLNDCKLDLQTLEVTNG